MMRRWLLAIAGVITGTGLVIASALVWSKNEWLSSTLGNAGVTIALAAPLAEYLRHVNEDVRAVARRVEEVGRRLDTEMEVVSDDERAKRVAQDVLSEKEQIRALLESGAASTASEIASVIRISVEDGIVARHYGIEIQDSSGLIFGFRIYSIDDVKWSQTSVGVHVRRPDSAHCISRATLVPYGDIAFFMGNLLARVKVAGGNDFEPLSPIRRLVEVLANLVVLREGAPDLVKNVQLVIDESWIFQTDGLVHLGSRAVVIPQSELRLHPAAHFENEPWFYDSARNAVDLVRSKLNRVRESYGSSCAVVVAPTK